MNKFTSASAMQRASLAVQHMMAPIRALTRMMFPIGASGWSSILFPMSRISYQQRVDAYKNSAVMACFYWIARTFPESPAVVQRRKGDQWDIVPDHNLEALLRRPNPFYSGELLWVATLLDRLFTGNAYWYKVRNSLGSVIQLWWVPSRFMEPVGSQTDPTVYIDHYEYTPNGIPQEIDPSEVVHFRDGLDPNDVRKGLSPLASLFREIYTDEEASAFSAALLRNMGVPGVVIAPSSPDAIVSADEAEMVKEKFDQSFGGDNRGKVMVMRGPTTITTFGFSPEQMSWEAFRNIPEERISAVIGVAAMVVGLGAGLERSTFSNYAEAREAAYEQNIIPTQRLMAEELTSQLLPDFQRDVRRYRVRFDTSEVRILQEDQNAKAIRLNTMVQGGWLKIADAQRQMGLEPDETQDAYLRTQGMVMLRSGEEMPRPEPPTPPGQDDEEEDVSTGDGDTLQNQENRNGRRNGAVPANGRVS